MAIYRNVQMTFWTDSKVVDNFTPEDKYFFLYLMTNPHTNLCGCYELSLFQASNETGYNKEAVERLLTRMAEVHHVIKYSKKTKEVLIINWGKFNWTKSADFQKPLRKEFETVKDPEFKEFLEIELEEIGTVLGRSYDPPTTTDTVTVINDDKYTNQIKEIINYLNFVTDSNYRTSTNKNRTLITARLNEGYTTDDFKRVIDKKYKEWKGTDWEKFVRPSTLFGNKFEEYLNQKGTEKKGNASKNTFTDIQRSSSYENMSELEKQLLDN